ncbi:hypothetical protein IH992_01590 [Candidatus Poribacteria bacterium]|nr:hypothetical protein [Candidatus Poribacteria bacterium]
MPNLNLREQLAGLHELQQIDIKILALHRKLESAPLKIKKLGEGLQIYEKQLNTKEEALSQAGKEQRSKTAQLEMEQEQRGKYQSQLRGVKTNKEYQALDKEISFLQEKEAEIEDEILASMLLVDQLKEELQQQQKVIDTEKAKNKIQKGECEKEIENFKAEIALHQEERKRFFSKVDRNLMNKCQEWLKRNGTGFVSLVIDNACSSCRITIPPQILKESRKYERIMFCPICKRILYPLPPSASDEVPTDEEASS